MIPKPIQREWFMTANDFEISKSRRRESHGEAQEGMGVMTMIFVTDE
jgi:hypothetical protein